MKNKWSKMLMISAATLGTAVLVPLTLATVNTNTQQNRGQGVGIERRMGPRGDGVVGTLTAINGNILTLKDKDGTVYTVDVSNAKVLIDRQESSLSNLAVNDEVMIRGTKNGTTITATIVHKGFENPIMEEKSNRMGTITALSGTTITLKARNGNTYTIDASKAQVLVDGQVSSLAFLAVNDEIHVRGTPGTNESSITAITIVKGDITSIPRYSATIKINSINGNTLTFTDMKGAVFTVDATNARVIVDGKDAKLSDLAVNDVLLLRGISTGETTISAHMLEKGKLPNPPKMGKGKGYRGGGMGKEGTPPMQ